MRISEDLFDNCFVGSFVPAAVSFADVETMAITGVLAILYAYTSF
jgi:hypothetical protein